MTSIGPTARNPRVLSTYEAFWEVCEYSPLWVNRLEKQRAPGALRKYSPYEAQLHPHGNMLLVLASRMCFGRP